MQHTACVFTYIHDKSIGSSIHLYLFCLYKKILPYSCFNDKKTNLQLDIYLKVKMIFKSKMNKSQNNYPEIYSHNDCINPDFSIIPPSNSFCKHIYFLPPTDSPYIVTYQPVLESLTVFPLHYFAHYKGLSCHIA